MTSRSSYVEIGTGKSSIKTQMYGVPQRSVLGPLYLIYVNEFATVVEDNHCTNPDHLDRDKLFGKRCLSCGDMTTYADDVEYIVAVSSRFRNQLRIEECFQKLTHFLHSNGLEINQGKIILAELMSKQKRVRLMGIPAQLTVLEMKKDKTQDKLITITKICRRFCGNLQNNLSLEGHLVTWKKALLPSIRRQLGMLGTLRDSLSMKARLHLVNSLIISKFAYIISLWVNTTENQMRRAQVTMNMEARYVTRKDRTTPKRTLMEDCEWLDVKVQGLYLGTRSHPEWVLFRAKVVHTLSVS